MKKVHTLIIGSGAAGLCAAVRLKAEGIDDILIATGGLDKGTSINTGSDKQTYYKLSLCGDELDSPRQMAETLFGGGSMHGDIALVEASLSARCFLHLVDLGVKFPTDAFGQFVGYKTDHDPRQRATSVGPYTSRDMCLALIRRVRELEIPVWENVLCEKLLKINENDTGRVCGALFSDLGRNPLPVIAENVVFAVGGPGDLYESTVYPRSQTSSIGLALAVGAEAQNLPESQFGMASTKFRWNVSGTYMQVIPRFISTDFDRNDEREFLIDYFDDFGDLYSKVFLKGYQWPFDVKKILSLNLKSRGRSASQSPDDFNLNGSTQPNLKLCNIKEPDAQAYSPELPGNSQNKSWSGSSSIIDILVYIETVERNRRVFLDYRSNPTNLDFEKLDAESRNYLEKSGALFGTPIERLETMNPGAIELYANNGIDLRQEMLEIAVCAQHNNGGLAGTIWWESTNIKHLFPIGEVNGSHGVARPGGSALNSGQVGAFRAAEFIANRYQHWTVDMDQAADAVKKAIDDFDFEIDAIRQLSDFSAIRHRMSRFGSATRNSVNLEKAVRDAWDLSRRLPSCDPVHLFALTHAVYLDAILFSVRSGVGSRGSGMVLQSDGVPIHEKLDPTTWSLQPEDESFRDKTLVTRFDPGTGQIEHRWEPVRPIPEADLWFETEWKKYVNGEIYGQ